MFNSVPLAEDRREDSKTSDHCWDAIVCQIYAHLLSNGRAESGFFLDLADGNASFTRNFEHI